MTKPTGHVHTRNVTKVLRRASDRDIEDGLGWYATAHQVAGELASEAGKTLAQAAGVIAATSPLNGWGPNVRLARRILTTGDTSRGYLPLGLTCSRRILDGEQPLDVLNGQKVRNFYLAIMTDGEDGIVIDRHAYDIAAGLRYSNEGRPGVGKGRYLAASTAYERASAIIGKELQLEITPARGQAISWTAWRRMHGIAHEDTKGIYA